MGLFSKLTDAIKDAAPVIGGVVGFGLGGPAGGALYAALGSGIGGLVAGQDVDEALKTAAIGGALGYGAGKMFPGSSGFLREAAGLPTVVNTSPTNLPQGFVQGVDSAKDFAVTPQNAATQALNDPSLFDKALGFAKENPLLTTAGLGSLAALGLTKEEEEALNETRPYPVGKMRKTPVTTYLGEELDLANPEDVELYTKRKAEVRDPSFEYPGVPRTMYHGGEVHGPGTGTSDSVPARLSDGEFVVTARAVRGAGNGDRDIGAARMYDMMSELEAMA